MPDIDSDSVKLVAGKVDGIAGEMPDSLSGLTSGADTALATNFWSTTAREMAGRVVDFSNGFELLTRQVAGFAADLRTCAEEFEDADFDAAEVFDRYGEDL